MKTETGGPDEFTLLAALRTALVELESLLAEPEFAQAVTALGLARWLHVAGVGKSGHVARLLAATFTAHGRPATFLHAGEAGHGDLGVVGRGDAVLCVSHSGATAETVVLARVARERGAMVVALTGGRENALAAVADVCLPTGVARDADPLGVPTVSAAAALALGQCLALAVARGREWTRAKFLFLHPAGTLGRA